MHKPPVIALIVGYCIIMFRGKKHFSDSFQGDDRLGLAMKDYTWLLQPWNARTKPLHLLAPPAQLHSARAPTRLAEDVLAFLDRTLSPSFPSSCF